MSVSVSAKSISVALEEIKKSKPRKFTQTITVAINLKDLDLNKPQNRVNAEIALLHAFKNVKICVIAQGDLALRAEKAGADKIIDKDELGRLGGNRKLAKKVAKSFDFFIVGIDLMPNVARFLGPVLGPLGKMPMAPPSGSGVIPVNEDIGAILEKYKKTIRVRMKKNPIIHCTIGNEKLEAKEIFENLQILLNYLEEHFEKGFRNIKSIYIKSTMSPSIKLNLG